MGSCHTESGIPKRSENERFGWSSRTKAITPPSGRRDWKKLHLGVDRTGKIAAQAFTHGSADDAKAALDLIDGIADDIASFTADAAYDTLATVRS